MIWVLPAIFFPYVALAPAAVQLHFFTTATFALILNGGLRNPTFRRMMKMAPRITKKVTTAPTSPYRGFGNTPPQLRASKSHASSRNQGAGAARSRVDPTEVPGKPVGAITQFRRGIGGFLKTADETMKSMLPRWLQSRGRSRNTTRSAERHEEARRKDMAQEKLAYEQQLARFRMRKR